MPGRWRPLPRRPRPRPSRKPPPRRRDGRRWTSPSSTGWPAIPSGPRPTQLLAMLVPEGAAPARPPIAGRLGPRARGAAGAGGGLAADAAADAAQTWTASRRSARRCSGHPAAPVAVLAAYLVGTLVFFPITLLLGATALLFPAPIAIVYCLAGALSAASTTYGIGRLVGRFRPRWLQRPRLLRVGRQLRRRGIAGRDRRADAAGRETSRSSTSPPARSASGSATT